MSWLKKHWKAVAAAVGTIGAIVCPYLPEPANLPCTIITQAANAFS